MSFEMKPHHTKLLDFFGDGPDEAPEACLDYIDSEALGLTEAQIRDGIGDLIEADLVVSRTDPNTGYEFVGLKEAVEAHEAPYIELKNRVYTLARSAGLFLKWQGWGEWALWSCGEEVERGCLDDLAAHLSNGEKETA